MGFSLKTVLLRLVQGFIIGAGGILPVSYTHLTLPTN